MSSHHDNVRRDSAPASGADAQLRKLSSMATRATKGTRTHDARQRAVRAVTALLWCPRADPHAAVRLAEDVVTVALLSADAVESYRGIRSMLTRRAPDNALALSTLALSALERIDSILGPGGAVGTAEGQWSSTENL